MQECLFLSMVIDCWRLSDVVGVDDDDVFRKIKSSLVGRWNGNCPMAINAMDFDHRPMALSNGGVMKCLIGRLCKLSSLYNPRHLNNTGVPPVGRHILQQAIRWTKVLKISELESTWHGTLHEVDSTKFYGSNLVSQLKYVVKVPIYPYTQYTSTGRTKINRYISI